MFHKIVVGILGLGIAVGGVAAAPPALADEAPVQIVSAQDLCTAIWPDSLAAPNPVRFGTVCTQPGGMLETLAKAMPKYVTNTFVLEPGSDVRVPVGSKRINESDPMSDWIIPGWVDLA